MPDHGNGGKEAKENISDYAKRVYRDPKRRHVIGRPSDQRAHGAGDNVRVLATLLPEGCSVAPYKDYQAPEDRCVYGDAIDGEEWPQDRGIAVALQLHPCHHQIGEGEDAEKAGKDIRDGDDPSACLVTRECYDEMIKSSSGERNNGKNKPLPNKCLIPARARSHAEDGESP